MPDPGGLPNPVEGVWGIVMLGGQAGFSEIARRTPAGPLTRPSPWAVGAAA